MSAQIRSASAAFARRGSGASDTDEHQLQMVVDRAEVERTAQAADRNRRGQVRDACERAPTSSWVGSRKLSAQRSRSASARSTGSSAPPRRPRRGRPRRGPARARSRRAIPARSGLGPRSRPRGAPTAARARRRRRGGRAAWPGRGRPPARARAARTSCPRSARGGQRDGTPRPWSSSRRSCGAATMSAPSPVSTAAACRGRSPRARKQRREGMPHSRSSRRDPALGGHLDAPLGRVDREPAAVADPEPEATPVRVKACLQRPLGRGLPLDEEASSARGPSAASAAISSGSPPPVRRYSSGTDERTSKP